MSAFKRIATHVDNRLVLAEIEANDHLFGEFNARREAPGSPHAQMQDIWVRYGDIKAMQESGDFTHISDEHDSIWLKDLPEVKRLCYRLMALVSGERLGGVLITKLPPGGHITPHADSGWHAEYYDKYFVPIQNDTGAIFGFEEGDIDADVGEVWQFDNSYTHWVDNDSDSDRIAIIICIRHDNYIRGGVQCLGV